MTRLGIGLALAGTIGLAALVNVQACAQVSREEAEIAPEDLTVAELPDPSPHWVWLNDVAFDHMPDGRAYLVDADSGKFLGMLSAGFAHAILQFSDDGKEIYNPEIYFSRGTRGTRTDVLSIYDAETLSFKDEVVIPPKRFSGIPTIGMNQLTDDGRFSLIYNYTPGQSVSIVDVEERRLVGEFETGGCALTFPSGPRSFFLLCADGGMMTVQMNDAGEVTDKQWREPFFDVEEDPLTEKPIRVGDTWYFVSFRNVVYPVSVTGDTPEVQETWSLTSEDELNDGWRIGGIQLLAAHEASGRLYALMHQGGPDTHKNPGTEIWVYDLDSGNRIARFGLERPATAIAVSQDDDPLLYTILAGDRSLHVHDADSGEMLRSIDQLGTTMMFIQTPPVAAE